MILSRSGLLPRTSDTVNYCTTPNVKLNPWFVTGFCDAEGCFNVAISRSSSCKIGWRVQARFIIELHIKDFNILQQLKYFFNNIGQISVDTRNNTATYSVVGIQDILTNIITHFDKYPLQSAKVLDFTAWKSVVLIMSGKGRILLDLWKYFL